jgi:hypothetical protein
LWRSYSFAVWVCSLYLCVTCNTVIWYEFRLSLSLRSVANYRLTFNYSWSVGCQKVEYVEGSCWTLACTCHHFGFLLQHVVLVCLLTQLLHALTRLIHFLVDTHWRYIRRTRHPPSNRSYAHWQRRGKDLQTVSNLISCNGKRKVIEPKSFQSYDRSHIKVLRKILIFYPNIVKLFGPLNSL